jgi:hypothetical protein
MQVFRRKKLAALSCLSFFLWHNLVFTREIFLKCYIGGGGVVPVHSFDDLHFSFILINQLDATLCSLNLFFIEIHCTCFRSGVQLN